MSDLGQSGKDDIQNSSPAGAASLRIEAVLEEAPQDGLTIDWLLAHFYDRSPEFLFLVLTPMAVLPATSTLAGALLLVVAGPLVFHQRRVFVPGFLARKKLSRAKVERDFRGLSAVLRYYESYAAKRPHPPARHHTRLVGIMVMTLAVALLVPLPLSNIMPALAVGAVALASLEQDGKLLILASLLAIVSLALVFVEVFSAYHAAHAVL